MIKDIKGYEGKYKIDDKGNVYSLSRIIKYKDGRTKLIKNKILTPVSNGKGYLRVNLFKDGHISNSFYIHRLVAETFIPNPNNYLEINHKDNNRKNNKADNLEWCDRKYNLKYSNVNDKINDEYKKNLYFVNINDKNDKIEIESLGKCSRLLNVSKTFIKNRINTDKFIKYNNKFYYIKSFYFNTKFTIQFKK